MKVERKVKEKEIENQILTFLNELPRCFAFKVATTGYYDAKKRVFRKNLSRYIIRGTSDIIGLFQGTFFAIEVKSPQGMREYLRQSNERVKNQKAFLDKVQMTGGIGICASSLDEVIALFRS